MWGGGLGGGVRVCEMSHERDSEREDGGECERMRVDTCRTKV